MLTRNRRIERAIELHLSTAGEAAMPRPALLPDAQDLNIAISKLQLFCERSAGAVARISDFYRERALTGD
ncbi:hypothetical protein ACFWP3_30035 [Streptomyces sp. NPDC058525]|uniref:hypothetical protein n=1 Tax=Streptomyces sp. NPDC058525 TaxID=3346538 RepID=UPI00364A84DA